MVSRLWSQESSSQVTLAGMCLFEGAGTFLPGTQGERMRKGPLGSIAFSPSPGPRTEVFDQLCWWWGSLLIRSPVQAASVKFRRHIYKCVGSLFLLEVSTSHIPRMYPFQGVPGDEPFPGPTPPTKLLFLLSSFACFSRRPRGARSRGLRMTVITEQGSSKRLISPILATKLINVI